MGITSNAAKQCWNANHYTQVKISVSPELAAAFKAKCKAGGVSMTERLSDFMRTETAGTRLPRPKPDPYETRPKRRTALKALIVQLEAIAEAEQGYIDKIPDSFHGSQRYEEAEETAEVLLEALELLAGAY